MDDEDKDIIAATDNAPVPAYQTVNDQSSILSPTSDKVNLVAEDLDEIIVITSSEQQQQQKEQSMSSNKSNLVEEVNEQAQNSNVVQTAASSSSSVNRRHVLLKLTPALTMEEKSGLKAEVSEDLVNEQLLQKSMRTLLRRMNSVFLLVIVPLFMLICKCEKIKIKKN